VATTDMGRKVGGCCALFAGGGAGSPSNTKSPGPRPTSIQSGILIHPALWLQHIWAENWGCPFGRGAGSPSNTMWPGPSPTCVPSFILIHPTFGHSTPTSLQTGQADRRTRQTENGLTANGRPKT